MIYFGGRAVLLIRNPLRAILSAYKHKLNGVHSGTEAIMRNNLGRLINKPAENIIRISQLENFALEQIENWKNIIKDWVTVGQVIVVFFEDVEEDKVRELTRIFQFLDLPVNENRLNCIRNAPIDLYKRKTSAYPEMSMFSENLKDKIASTIDQVNAILKVFGHQQLPAHYYAF